MIVLCLLKNNLCTLITLSNEWLFVACCKTKFDYIEYTEMMLGGGGFLQQKKLTIWTGLHKPQLNLSFN